MKKQFLVLPMTLLFLSAANAQVERFHWVTTNNSICSGSCGLYAWLSTNGLFHGRPSFNLPGAGPWDASHFTDFDMTFYNPAMPDEPYDGTNLATANPLPIDSSTVAIESTGGGSSTGGIADEFGSMVGKILYRITIPELAVNDTWLVLDFAAGDVVFARLCTFFETAGCVAGATEFTTTTGSAFYFAEGQMIASPDKLDFGQVVIGQSAQTEVTLTNADIFAVVLSFLPTGLQAPFSVEENCPTNVILSTDTCTVTVDFSPTMLGGFSDQVFMRPVNSDQSTGFNVFGTGVVALDTDGDGVTDDIDNCIDVVNFIQHDTNGDGFGNACDPDLDNNCIVNFLDMGLFADQLFQSGVLDSDFNGDGAVNFLDFPVFTNLVFLPPGPSGLSSCNP